MSDINTNTLIHNVVIDIIGITSFWGFVNLNYHYENQYNENQYSKFKGNINLFTTTFGIGFSVYLMQKYMKGL